MIKGDWIKPGAVVIDFGVNFVGEQMWATWITAAAQEVAGMITPVPGGTGPDDQRHADAQRDRGGQEAST